MEGSPREQEARQRREHVYLLWLQVHTAPQAYGNTGRRTYKEALADGMAPEQARLLLPAYGMYVRWRWTVSLNGVLAFLTLRLDEHAQWEIRQYAERVDKFVHQYYPITSEAWRKYRV